MAASDSEVDTSNGLFRPHESPQSANERVHDRWIDELTESGMLTMEAHHLHTDRLFFTRT